MERLMRRLNGSLSRSVRRSVQDIFQQSPLDLRFALQKTLDPRVSFTRAGSAANAATYVDANGIIQRAVTNLCLQSEDFSQNQATDNVSILTNQITAPNNTLTADLVTATLAGTANTCWLQQLTSITASTATYIISCFVKQGTSPNVTLNIAMGGGTFVQAFANFNFTTKAIVLTGNGAASAISDYQQLENGWYRLWLSLPNNNTGTSVTHRVYTRSEGTANVVGDSVYLWGRQLEQASTVGDYVPTTSVINSAPRFDHNPTTGESLGLLVEEARTNGIRNNTMVGAVAGTPGTNPNFWQYVTTQSNGLAVSVVGTGVENGINYIDYRFNGTTVASPNGIAFGIDSTTAATAESWTNSLYWKLAGGTATGVTAWQIGIIENTAVGTFVTGANYSQTAPTSAALITQRPAATRTFSGGVTVGQAQMTLTITVAGSTAIDFTIRIGLPQMEKGAFATSVIPTTSATVTRAADVASIDGSNFSSFYNQTEGTVFASAQRAVSGSSTFFGTVSDGTGNNRIQFGYGDTSNGNFASVVSGSLTGETYPSVSTLLRNGAFAYGSTAAVSYNGGSTSQFTPSALPTVNQLSIGSYVGSSTPYLNGTIKRLTYWPVRLANTTLQQITQP
jgi:hypothetical protein